MAKERLQTRCAHLLLAMCSPPRAPRGVNVGPQGAGAREKNQGPEKKRWGDAPYMQKHRTCSTP